MPGASIIWAIHPFSPASTRFVVESGGRPGRRA